MSKMVFIPLFLTEIWALNDPKRLEQLHYNQNILQHNIYFDFVL